MEKGILLYNEISDSILSQISGNNRIAVSNKDFYSGTYIIDKPGYYILTEDIIFNPNSPYSKYSDCICQSEPVILDNNFDWMPTYEQSKEGRKYAHSSFFLGFYSAINVESSNVIIDLNNFSIRQHKLHALQQRFFQTIQLNNSPFIINQGPTKSFSDSGFIETENIIIKNGFIGLSSHYGIHGNNNKNVVLDNLNITDFECGGVSFNHIQNLVMLNVNIFRNRKDTPVSANYSILRCAKLYLQKIDKNILENVYFNNESGVQILNNLLILERNIIENYIKEKYKKIITSNIRKDLKREIKKYFVNQTGINEGSTIVGCQITPKGVAIHGFTDNVCPNRENCLIGDFSKNVYLINVVINDITANPEEIIFGKSFEKDINGCLGDKINIKNIVSNEGYYRSGILNNSIFYIDKLSKMDLDFKPLTTINVPTWLSNWVYGRKCSIKFKNLVIKEINKNQSSFYLVYGKDIMGHINKGSIALRMGGTHNINIKNVLIFNIHNIGKNTEFDSSFKDIENKIQSLSNIEEETGQWYIGANSTGVIFSSCKELNIKILRIHNISSTYGKSFPLLNNIE